MPRRSLFLTGLLLTVWGCGGTDPAQEEAAREYMRLMAATQVRFMAANQTFALNMDELKAMDAKLKEMPEGYSVQMATVLMSYGWSARATPDGSGTSYFIDDSGVLRENSWGVADEESAPVE